MTAFQIASARRIPHDNGTHASRRAIAWLESSGIATYETLPMAKDALKWAAYTYVIAAIGSLATLFYYIGLGSRR